MTRRLTQPEYGVRPKKEELSEASKKHQIKSGGSYAELVEGNVFHSLIACGVWLKNNSNSVQTPWDLSKKVMNSINRTPRRTEYSTMGYFFVRYNGVVKPVTRDPLPMLEEEWFYYLSTYPNHMPSEGKYIELLEKTKCPLKDLLVR